MRAALPVLLALLTTACRSGDKADDDVGEIGAGDYPVDADGDGAVEDEDCDDADADTYPGAEEVCDGVDNDCDGETDEGLLGVYYEDADGDGYGDPETATSACEAPEGFVAIAEDCDDGDADTYPEAPERCDEVDNDCDGEVDEDVQETWYADADADGHGDPESTLESCDPDEGYVASASDCDDANPAISPVATELCDGVDNDCDGEIDEDDAADAATWYADTDGDGYGDPENASQSCDQPSGTTMDASDCDDTDAAVNPAADEACNGVDDDCDGLTDDEDSDVSDPSTWYADDDGDGYGDVSSWTQSCTQPSGTTTDPGSSGQFDCDDGEASINPGAAETCNETDDDCDGDIDEGVESAFYRDADGDGYGDAAVTTEACSVPSGYSADDTDCDDLDGDVNPGATEVCNEVDDDCDGHTDDADSSLDSSSTETWYADDDADGYGDPDDSQDACEEPSGYVDDDSDCDDTDEDINPLADDVCNGVDDDCDGTLDENALDEAMLVTLDDDELVELDPGTSWTTLITVDDSSTGSLTQNSIAGTLDDTVAVLHDYNSSEGFRTVELETCDGSMTSAGAHGAGNLCGLAFDNDGRLWGMDTTSDELVEVDPSSGAATSVGSLSESVQNCGMTYDCSTDTLYAMEVNTSTNVGTVYSVGRSSGTLTAELTLDSSVTWTGAGIAYNPVDQVFYAATGSGVYEVDSTTGGATQLWTNSVNNLAYVYSTCE